jgi:uncharacterized protein (TIGR02391 family)
MRLNFHQYRDEVKHAILHFKVGLDSSWDPFAAAWLAYALSQDGIEANPPLSELTETLSRWSKQPEAWEFQRHLGPLSILVYLRHKRGQTTDEVMERVLQQIEALDVESRFSTIRDPEQVFLIALGVASTREQEKKGKQNLLRTARDQMKGPQRRRILYAAAVRELGENVDPAVSSEAGDSGDVIASVWWSERYLNTPDRSQWWVIFENIKDNLVFSGEVMAGGQRVLSAPELALLYEALVRETKEPDPNLLFQLYPLHARVREIADKHFKEGSYAVAVDQATKVLNELIQKRSGVSNKSEAELVQATMKQLDHLKLKFNDFLGETSGKNEQAGLALITEGIFKAFRNPKGHKPEDHPLVQIDPYEAVDQLIAISYVMKRIEQAK